MKFIPCNGNCTFEGLYCDGCGRTHQEIEAMRKSVDDLLDLAKRMKYENLEEFADAVSSSTPLGSRLPARRRPQA